MTLTTIFREIFLRLNILAEQCRGSLSAMRALLTSPRTADAPPVPEETQIPDTPREENARAAEPVRPDTGPLRIEEPKQLPQTDIDRIAAALAPRQTFPEEPERQVAAAMPPNTLTQDDIDKIAERTAEQIKKDLRPEEPAAELPLPAPAYPQEIPEAELVRLENKLDAILAAVRNHGEQLKKLSEIDGDTIFFS